MPGPVIANPVPPWLRPENASVLDGPFTKLVRGGAHLLGLDDPQQAVLAMMTPMMPEGAGPARKLAGAFSDLVERPIRAYHGSPNMLLERISANPANRQFPNAASELGAFFHIDADEAARYADMARKGETGRVYAADLPLKNPKELTWGEFGKFSSVEPERIAEARALRQQLEAAGHDGIIVRNTKGYPIEIASFKDVPLPQRVLPFDKKGSK